MSFLDAAKVMGRRAASIVEIDLDSCSQEYAVAPCTASAALSNMLFNSDTFSDTVKWPRTNVNFAANVLKSPNSGATLRADRIRPTAAVTNHYIQQVIPLPTFTIRRQAAASVYVRAEEPDAPGGFNFKVIEFSVSWGFFYFARMEFDAYNGVLIDADTGIQDSGYSAVKTFNEDGVAFWRLAMGLKVPDGVGVTSLNIRLRVCDDDGTYLVGSPDTNKGIIVADAQYVEDADQFGPGKYARTTTALILGGAGSQALCFNTLGTCQDVPNYTKEVKTFRFIEQQVLNDSSIDAYPCVKNISYAPTKIEVGSGFSIRATATVTLQDFSSNDISVDKYVYDRAGDAASVGTFFNKLKARNKYYSGRPIRILEGYLDADGLLTDYITRTYIIDEIKGPDVNGNLQITGKDVLNLARNKRSEAPLVKDIALNGAVTISQTLNWLGDGADVADILANDYIRVDDEICKVTIRHGSGDVDVLRAQWGTVAAAHDDNATITHCVTFIDTPVIDVIYTLLTDYAGIDPAFIDYADWQAEETESLAGYDLTNILSEPKSVNDYLKEITEVTLIDLFYDDAAAKIRLTLNGPYADVTRKIDDAKIIKDSFSIKEANDKRLTRIIINYARKNYAIDDDEISNYARTKLEIAANEETEDYYGDTRIQTVFSSWVDASNSPQVALTAARLLDRFANVPQEITFDIDAKDIQEFSVGEVFDLDSRSISGGGGFPLATRFQIMQQKLKRLGHRHTLTAFAFFAAPEVIVADYVISTNKVDFNLHDDLGNPTNPLTITVVVDVGVTLTATQGNYAFTTGSIHPDSQITLINKGNIYGHSGLGGVGGNGRLRWRPAVPFGFPYPQFYYDIYQPGNGNSGGNSIEITTSAFSLDNTLGKIYSGGGGGGGGTCGVGRDPYTNVVYPAGNGWERTTSGNGGGGGRGSDGTAAAPGLFERWDFSYVGGGVYVYIADISIEGGVSPEAVIIHNYGNFGIVGTTAALGAGGAQFITLEDPADTNAGHIDAVALVAAAGGDWGESGAGYSDAHFTSLGGVAGFAIVSNGAIINYLDGGPTATDIKGGIT